MAQLIECLKISKLYKQKMQVLIKKLLLYKLSQFIRHKLDRKSKEILVHFSKITKNKFQQIIRAEITI